MKLAIFGGKKTINKKFNKHNSIGREEKKTVSKVIDSGFLSNFYASDLKRFFGGYQVLKFEKKIRNFFKVKYAITVNSWTSGLIASVVSLNIEPGDEIIVSPFTMSASAMAILHANAIPVFSDVDKKTFCLDPNLVEKKITRKTKAIMLVDINGHPSDIVKFKRIAKKYNLKLIIDAAQSIGAKYKVINKFAGTIGDVGGFSLNCHKHINTGEGGIVVTNNKSIAEKIQLLRNHGENMVHKFNIKNKSNIIGYNFRMGEIEAAIGIEQLKKFPRILKKIQSNSLYLTSGLRDLKGLNVPFIDSGCTHAFYNYGLTIDTKIIKASRKQIVKALKAEGVPCAEGYLNLHLLPMFQIKNIHRSKKFPWSVNKSKITYNKGICPVAEKLHSETYIAFPVTAYNFSKGDIKLIIRAFCKVWENLKLVKLIK
jgi:perosamine synthetase